MLIFQNIVLVLNLLTLFNNIYGLTDDIINNDGQTEKLDIFKLKKYNEIWARAITRNLHVEKLEGLKRTLTKLDRQDFELKHAGVRVDKDTARQNFLNEVLREYGLFNEDVPVQDHDDIFFHDSRINHLWQQALEEGHFSKNELNSLHKEMLHMEEKMKNVHALHKETESMQKDVHSVAAENDPHNYLNLVDEPTNENSKDLDTKKLDAMHAKLKQEKAILSDHVLYLQDKVRNKANMEKSDFTDDRVSRLWHLVQNSKEFKGKELEEVREELRHFQKYIDKLEHWERFNKKVERGENKGDKEHAQEKLEEYKRKVKKYHDTMIKKMKEFRVEL